MERLKEIVHFYTTHLYLVDYMLILFVFFLFTCVLLLCIFLRHKPVAALLIIALNIIICFLIYTYGYKFIDSEVRSRKTTIVEQKFIQSSEALIIDFNITNTSKNDFKQCKVIARIFKDKLPEDNLINEYKNQLIPFRQKSREIFNLKKIQLNFKEFLLIISTMTIITPYASIRSVFNAIYNFSYFGFCYLASLLYFSLYFNFFKSEAKRICSYFLYYRDHFHRTFNLFCISHYQSIHNPS